MSRIPEPVRRLAVATDRVLTVAQLEAAGFERHRAADLVRDGLWQRPYRGVYITHSGPLFWPTRARAALAYAGTGAALSHDAAAHEHGFGTGLPRVVDVVVPRGRTVTRAPGLRVHRPRRDVAPDAPPGGLPRTPAAVTVVDLVNLLRREDDVVGLVTRAVRAGVPVADIAAEALRRPTTRGRALLLELVGEVEEGIESPMERRYRRDVERKHGLPASVLQARAEVDGRRIRSDTLYEEYGLRVELDGRPGHPGGRTDQDTWRDNHVMLAYEDVTLRYRWTHVAFEACRTAVQVGRGLNRGGWTDRPHPCSRGCAVAHAEWPAVA